MLVEQRTEEEAMVGGFGRAPGRGLPELGLQEDV